MWDIFLLSYLRFYEFPYLNQLLQITLNPTNCQCSLPEIKKKLVVYAAGVETILEIAFRMWIVIRAEGESFNYTATVNIKFAKCLTQFCSTSSQEKHIFSALKYRNGEFFLLCETATQKSQGSNSSFCTKMKNFDFSSTSRAYHFMAFYSLKFIY